MCHARLITLRWRVREGFDVTTSAELVSRLWRLCTLLRKDGVTYPQYVTELTYLMFLKLLSERTTAPGEHGADEWSGIVGADDDAILDRYRATLARLGSAATTGLIATIFNRAETVVRDPQTLRRLVDAIDGAEWHSDDRDWFGDAYEGLLQKNAEETKRGAGQYFTPRALVDAIVGITRPRRGEVIQDPAAGTGGFLIAAKRAIATHPGADAPDAAAFRGVENVMDTYRLLCMNLYLHGIDPSRIFMGDTLSALGSDPSLGNADLILSNPPFGASGGMPTREDLPITARATSFQLPFVEHCVRALAPGGRAAVIVPDNILFEGGRGRTLRRFLMETCDLHTILRLPTRIFYAQGVRTNVLFFNRPPEPMAPGATEAVWIYDMRANVAIGDRGAAGLSSGLADFAAAFGDDPLGRAERVDTGAGGRFRRFTRREIADRDDDLYITWLREEGDVEQGLEFAAPDDVAAVIEQHLVLALDEIRALIGDLGDDALEDDAE